MPLFGKRESSPPTPPKSLGGMFRESLFGSARPTPKLEQKPQGKPELRKLFGKEDYASFQQQRRFAEKAPREPLPGTGRKLGKGERVGLTKELQERAKKAGQLHGISGQAWRERILPQMKKEKYRLHISGKPNEVKALEKKIQQYERWIKGI